MFSEKTHRYIYLFGLCGLAFGMMIGTVPTSVPQIILMGNWLLEGRFKQKWQQLAGNKLFWVMSAAFLIHVLGLLYTNNLGDGLNDVRTKMPLMFLPLIFFSAKSLSQKEFHGLLYCLIAGSVANTLWCLTYSFVLHTNEVVRNTSRFMSHIRLGLYLNVAIACCVYFFIHTSGILKKTGFVVVALYFVFILYILGLATGLMNFALLFFLGLCYIIYRQATPVKIISFLVLACFAFLLVNYLHDVKEDQLTVKKGRNNTVLKATAGGVPYIHFDTTGKKENGNYIFINIQLEELQREWKARVPDDSFSYKPAHNLTRYEVLVRYLASKGLNKDSAGIARLNNADINNIRKNVPNYEYPGWSFLRKRTYELVNEYDEFMNSQHVNGQSLTMRLYFWKAAADIVRRNPIAGVGTGDVQDELNRTYFETHSPLDKEWYKRPHNQFLTVTVALGFIGLLIFMISIFYPVIVLRKHLPTLFWPFFIIAIFSFTFEDTLETQAGLSFFAFFNTLFLAMAYYKNNETSVE